MTDAQLEAANLPAVYKHPGAMRYFKKPIKKKEGAVKRVLNDTLALFKFKKGADGVRRRVGDIKGWPEGLLDAVNARK